MSTTQSLLSGLGIAACDCAENYSLRVLPLRPGDNPLLTRNWPTPATTAHPIGALYIGAPKLGIED